MRPGLRETNTTKMQNHNADHTSSTGIKMLECEIIDIRKNTSIKGPYLLDFDDMKHIWRRGQPPRGGVGEPRGLVPQREPKHDRGRPKHTDQHSKKRGFRNYSSHLRRAERRRVKRAVSRTERRHENVLPRPSCSRAMAPRGHPDCHRICMSLN